MLLTHPVSRTSFNNTMATVTNGTIAGADTITGTIQDCGTTRTATNIVEAGIPNYFYEIVPQPVSVYTTCHKLNKYYTFKAQPFASDPVLSALLSLWPILD